MDKFIIKGGKVLNGKVKAGGAKNASLALIPAALLASGTSKLFNTPALNDVYTMLKLVRHLGVEATFENDTITMDTAGVSVLEAPYEHVKKMRASVYVLGPLLARHGYAKVSLPGGCAWGPRPINLHIEGLKKLGAHIDLVDGYIIAKAKRLKGPPGCWPARTALRCGSASRRRRAGSDAPCKHSPSRPANWR